MSILPEPCSLDSKFKVGDRVAALANTEWDEDNFELKESCSQEERDYFRLHGHYGHVVETCEKSDCPWTGPHVLWQGTFDKRTVTNTSWLDGHHWHMGDDEIEHID